MDQRNGIKFCVKNKIKCARTCEMLTVACEESTMSRTHVRLWYNRFKEGREDARDAKRYSFWSPEPSSTDENIEAVKKMILDNSRITIWEVADDVAERYAAHDKKSLWMF